MGHRTDCIHETRTHVLAATEHKCGVAGSQQSRWEAHRSGTNSPAQATRLLLGTWRCYQASQLESMKVTRHLRSMPSRVCLNTSPKAGAQGLLVVTPPKYEVTIVRSSGCCASRGPRRFMIAPIAVGCNRLLARLKIARINVWNKLRRCWIATWTAKFDWKVPHVELWMGIGIVRQMVPS